MALTDSLPTGDAGGLTIADERLILSGLIVKNADGTARTGIFPSGAAPIVTGRASMGYDIAPFRAVVSRTGAGVELLANDAAVVNVPTDAAPGANSRIDVIYVRPQFTASADASNVPVFGVAKGTAAAIPSKPAIPAGALELATAEILSSATTTASAVITQTARYTAAAGGIVPFRNLVELSAWTTAPQGQYAQDLSTTNLLVRSGSAWVSSDGATILALTAFSPNWSQTSSQPAFLVVRGKNRSMHVVASRGAGGTLASIITIPEGHRPSANLFLPGNVTSGGIAYALGVQSNGIVWIPYGGGNSAAAYPLVGSWEVA